MNTNDSRLVGAVRRLTQRRAPPAVLPHGGRAADTPAGGRDWQQLIETELDSLNRRLSAIEARMTVTFYLVVILTVTTVVTNADAAQALLRGVLQIR